MEKLEYDSLHKFLVSLGLIFLTLPFLIVFYLFGKDVILISKEEFETLSDYSRRLLEQQNYLTNILHSTFPYLCVVLFLVGVILLYIGIKNWKKVQKDIDAVITADRIKSELETNEMKQSDKFKQTIEEVQEGANINLQPSQSVIMRHMDIEDQYFHRMLPLEIKSKYYIKRNLKVGKYEYDGIAISKQDNIDIIYEIKVWKQPRSAQMLRTSLERLYKAGVNYETLKHRNFRCILVIVTTNEFLREMEQWVNRFSHNETEYDFSNIHVEYVSEEDLSI